MSDFEGNTIVDSDLYICNVPCWKTDVNPVNKGKLQAQYYFRSSKILIEKLIGQKVRSSAFVITLSEKLQLQCNYKYLDDWHLLNSRAVGN